MAGPEVMQVLMHGVLKKDFETWLTSRGLVLQRTPFLDDDEDPDDVLPTYLVTPHPDRMKGWKAP
jgi:hypothetical protein